MSSASPFPITPRKRRAASGVEEKLYDPLTTPIRFPEIQNTPDSHSVPELDWGLSPETADLLPVTPTLVSTEGQVSIRPRRPLKQLRRSSRIQAQTASDCANPECASKDAVPIFSPSIYSLLPSLPRLSDFVRGDISWRNSSFFELSRAPSSILTTASASATQRLPHSRRGIRSNTAEPLPKRSKEKAEPTEENHPSYGLTRIFSPTVVQVPKATTENPAYLKKETNPAFTGVTRRRFSRILPLETVERVWEDEQRCVASLVARPDVRCLALVKSSEDVKKWICHRLPKIEAASDLDASEGYIRELLSFTTCTAHHRNIAEQQLDRLLDCYHNRCSQHIKSKHNFTKRDMKAVQYWLTSLTSLIDKADHASAEQHRQTRVLPTSTVHVPAAVQDLSEFAPTPGRILQTLEPEEALVNKLEVLRKDVHAQSQALVKTTNGAIHSCTRSAFDQFLSVLKVDPQRSTCIGITKTGVICKVPVAKTSREQALGLLRTSSGFPSSSTLELVSGLLLCKRWHQDQAAVISSKWSQNCKTGCIDQRTHTNETVQEFHHRLESTSPSHKELLCEYSQVKHSHDDCGFKPQSHIIARIAAMRREGAVRKAEDAHKVDESSQRTMETVSTTEIARTTETSRILTSSTKRIETETMVSTAELRQISTRSQTPPIAQVASIKVQSKFVTRQQSLRLVAPSIKSREAALVAIHQRFSWYRPGKSGHTSVESLLHESLNLNMTPREYQRPLKDPEQLLTYPSQSLNYPGQGLIYMYWVPGNFGFVKIGKTSGESTERRLKEWRESCGHALEEYTRGETGLALQLPHAHRVERLVHTELKDYRIREDRCENMKCGRAHIEWFYVPQDHALRVIEKWSSWIKTRPYIEVNGIWRLKEPISVDDILCKPIELELGIRCSYQPFNGVHMSNR
jgi:hypothetical protein